MATPTTPPRHTRIPTPSELSEQQIRGAACVYCGVHLDNETAIDLGEHHVTRAGSVVRWFPRACRQHGEAAQ